MKKNSETILTTYRNKKSKYKRFTIFSKKKASKKVLDKKERRKSKAIKVVKVIIVILAILLATQYIYMKYQMTKYNIDDGYTCVHMSYDAEKFFEGLGFHTVQRRVMGVHRWVAIELWDGFYVDYESTLGLFGVHLINDEMVNQYVYQSEGFFDHSVELVRVKTIPDIHNNLDDWKIIGMENGSSNLWFFESLP